MALVFALAIAAAAVAPAERVTLDQAVAAAFAHAPALEEAQAQRDAAGGRLTEARAAQRPSAAVSGSIGTGWLDPRGFFGLQGKSVVPRSAQATIEQPLFTGGRARAGIDQARAGQRGANAAFEMAKGQLAADVAAAFGAVLVAEEQQRLYEAMVAETREIERQAQLRFGVGESPRTDVSQASARLAEAQAGLARASGDIAIARARLQTLTGLAPASLAPLPAPPQVPAVLQEALDAAESSSPAIAEARAALDAASAAARLAKAERMPTVGAFAEASTVADQFFPDYRANGAAVGIRARWQLTDGGRTGGRIVQASAAERAADARLRAARDRTTESVIAAFEAVRTAELVERATADQAAAADQAVDNVRHEVRVGEKPQLDLLNAEREALAANVDSARARSDRVASAYRLNALLGRY